jgi:hypothetical protein
LSRSITLLREAKKMIPTTRTPLDDTSRSAHVEEMLDDALKATFPASDPVAITSDRPVVKGSMQLPKNHASNKSDSSS